MAVSVQHLLTQYGYWAIFFAIFFEDFGIPVPGETLLITASIFASQGKLHLPLLLLFAWSAAVLGDNVGFLIGHFGGRRLLQRFGRYIFITPARLERTETLFRKRGGWIVIVARFLEVFRQLNGILAGTVGMPWRRFILFNALGAAGWVCFWSTLFYFFGGRVHQIVVLFKRYELPAVMIGAVAGLAVLAVLIVHWRRSKHNRRA